MLYLRGVPYSQLVSVLTFMYRGEVSVAQEQLNSFLHTAEDLKVKGLTQGGAAVQKPQRREVGAPLSNEPRDADVEEIQEIPVKVEAANTVAVDEDPLDAGYDYLDQDQSGLQYDNLSSYDTHNMELDKGSMTSHEIDALIKMKIVKNEHSFSCTDCDYTSSLKNNAEKHVEAQHIRPGVFCQYCSKVCPTRHALRMHLKRNHNTIPSLR